MSVDEMSDLGRDLGHAMSEGGRSRRIFARAQQEGLESSLGQVFDLSKGGARVLARRTFKGVQTIQIHASCGDLEVQAEVVWSKKLAFRQWMLGIQFIGISPRAASTIDQIMKAHAAQHDSAA